MNLIKLAAVLAVVTLFGCASTVSDRDRDLSGYYEQTGNGQRQQYDQNRYSSPLTNIPYGEQPSHYPPYYVSPE